MFKTLYCYVFVFAFHVVFLYSFQNLPADSVVLVIHMVGDETCFNFFNCHFSNAVKICID